MKKSGDVMTSVYISLALVCFIISYVIDSEKHGNLKAFTLGMGIGHVILAIIKYFL